MSQDVDIVRRWVDESGRIVALTGAGISTESGIPDFRGPQGVWTKDPKAERLSNIHEYMSNAEVRKLSWKSRLDHPAWRARPNAGHRALVEIERRGKLHALITQNIDGLHQQAGNCDWRGRMQPILDRVRAGEDDPPCERCGGILKSATISFGQPLVPEVIERAMRAAADAELLLAVGTSLQVYPVAGAVPAAKAAGARVVIMNAEPTPLDNLADALLRMPIGEVLPDLCGGAHPDS
ncbi:MAG: NAD-dependent deacetylase [Acidobacteria bacterium 13_1_40CM_3_56_11]|nr:MAG: NAD-dependent deacetylase [Acidobacteria bacterium 13_1_40CM_3_56_11]